MKRKVLLSALVFIPLLTSCANQNPLDKSYNNFDKYRVGEEYLNYTYDLEKMTTSIKNQEMDLNNHSFHTTLDDLSPIGSLIERHKNNIRSTRYHLDDNQWIENIKQANISEKFRYKDEVCEFNTIVFDSTINPTDYYKDYYFYWKNDLYPWSPHHFEFYDQVAFLESEGCGELIQKWAKESHLKERLLLRPKGYRDLKIKIDNKVEVNSQISINTLFDKILADYNPDKNDKIFNFQQPLVFSSTNLQTGDIVDHDINTNFSIIGDKAQEDLKNNMKENVDYYRNSINKTLKNLIKTRNYGDTIFSFGTPEERGFKINTLEQLDLTRDCSKEQKNMFTEKGNGTYSINHNLFYNKNIKDHLKEDLTYKQFNDAFWNYLANKYFPKKKANELLSYWTRHKVPQIIRETESSSYFDKKYYQECKTYWADEKLFNPAKKRFN